MVTELGLVTKVWSGLSRMQIVLSRTKHLTLCTVTQMSGKDFSIRTVLYATKALYLAE